MFGYLDKMTIVVFYQSYKELYLISTVLKLAVSLSTLEPACMVHGYKVFWHIRSVFGWVPILDS